MSGKGRRAWKKRRMMRIMNGGCCKRGTAMEFIMDKKVEALLLNIKFKIRPMSRTLKKAKQQMF
jgi:DhnA family fructose-bisphosphate aldolase class Ia